MKLPKHMLKRIIQELDTPQKETLIRLKEKETLTGEDFQNTLKILLHDLDPQTQDKTIKKMMRKAKIKPDQTLTTEQNKKLKNNLLNII